MAEPTELDVRRKFYAPAFAIKNHDNPINFDHVHSIETRDDLGIKINDGRYQIMVYAANPHSKNPVITWRFVEKDGDHGRDAAFEKLKNIITTFV